LFFSEIAAGVLSVKIDSEKSARHIKDKFSDTDFLAKRCQIMPRKNSKGASLQSPNYQLSIADMFGEHVSEIALTELQPQTVTRFAFPTTRK
jgi:hypothetical protein